MLIISSARGRQIVALFAFIIFTPGCTDRSRTPARAQLIGERENGAVSWPSTTRGTVTRIAPADLSSAPTIDATLELVIGSGKLGANDELAVVSGIAIDSSNRIYVYDPRAYRIRVFQPTGQFIRDIGRRGHGPGEFDFPHGNTDNKADNGIAISHDSLFALDNQLLIFDTAGNYLSSRRGLPFRSTAGVAASSSGLTFSFTDNPDYRRMDYRFVTADISRDEPAVVDSFRVSQFFYDYGSSFYAPPLPHGVLPYNISGDGHIYFAPGDSLQIDVRRHNGTLEKSIIGQAPRVRVVASDIEDLEASKLARVRGAQPEISDEAFDHDWAPVIRKALQGRSHAQYRESIGNIIVSQSGLMLVSRPDLSERPYRFYTMSGLMEWLMLDDNGHILGRLKLPIRFFPRVFKGCSLLGVDEDLNGNPLVKEYRLQTSCLQS